MIFKKKYFGIIITLVNVILIVSAIYVINHRSSSNLSNVLGVITKVFSSPTPVLPTSTPTPIPTDTPTPTPIDFSISIVHKPGELTERETATFSWLVGGSGTTIHTSTVYMGTTSTPGILSHVVSPAETRYNYRIKDFLDGQYNIPLVFTGNQIMESPGTYFARAYALIEGKHYWSEETLFVVKPIPLNTIQVLDFPAKIKTGESAHFTWDISGPVNKTGYTVIVGGKESKAGSLDESVAVSATPYNSVMVNDFTGGTYNVPLRFVGNGVFTGTGTYYLRAVATINNKNIWSDEFSVIVE